MAEGAPDTKQQIAVAAIQMFRQYGYAKTTVGDIAKACHMSPANIYRFFSSKDAIIESIATDYLNQKLQAAREISTRKLSASQRLEAFALEILRMSCDEFVTEQRLVEIVIMCVDKHRDIVEAFLQAMRDVIRDVVQQGMDSGEFTVTDAKDTGDAVFDSLCKFHHPQMIAQHLQQPLEEQARRLIRLLCRGMRSREAEPANA